MQTFFNFLEMAAQHFTSIFYRLPPQLFHALMQCAAGSLALQERYSLVSACQFLVRLKTHPLFFLR